MKTDALHQLIRTIPDFPKPGIQFKDITPLLADPEALDMAARALADPFRELDPGLVCAVEARGFILGPLVARHLGAGFVPVRKQGKLPYKTRQLTYDLEYGTDTLEIHEDAVAPQSRVLMLDDVLATGGTMAAACQLVSGLGAQIVGCAFLIELGFLKGRDRIADWNPIHAVLDY